MPLRAMLPRPRVSDLTGAGNAGHGGLSGGSSGYTEGKGLAADFIAAHYGVPPINVTAE